MSFHVVTQHWFENSIGEQGNGPPCVVATYPTRAEAEARARREEVFRVETSRGGAYGVWAFVMQAKED